MSFKDWLNVYICIFVWLIVFRDVWLAYKVRVTRKYILAMKKNVGDAEFIMKVLSLSEFTDNKKPSVRSMKKYIKEHKVT